MTDEPSSGTTDSPVPRRPNPVVTWMLAGLPLLACLVLAVPHAQALRQARGFLSGVQLSPGEQVRFGTWNRTLVLRDVGVPEPVTVRSLEDRPVADPEETDVVIAVTTRFVLDVPAPGRCSRR
jgi:hypothetical protein